MLSPILQMSTSKPFNIFIPLLIVLNASLGFAKFPRIKFFFFESFLPLNKTLCPSSSRFEAILYPIPLDEPVTIIFFFNHYY